MVKRYLNFNPDAFVKNVGLTNNPMTLTDEAKQKRVEDIYYYKVHLDFIVVSLAIVYLVYQIKSITKSAS